MTAFARKHPALSVVIAVVAVLAVLSFVLPFGGGSSGGITTLTTP